MLELIERHAEQAIEKKVFPGCVIGILKNGERSIMPFGHVRYERGDAVSAETVYDLASVTKSIPVASLALELMGEGRFSLAHTVKMFVPELQNHYGTTIEDLLLYRVRGPRLSELAARLSTYEEIRTHILEHGFDGPPGESAYSNLPAYILGLVIERVAGESIASLAHKNFFDPLGMSATTFFPAASDCAPTEIDPAGEVCGLPHDESARSFAKGRRSVGHAGLFSSAGDLVTFFDALFSGAFPAVLEGAVRELGWQINEPHWVGGHSGLFGKTGFTGTSVLADPERKIALVILSNRTFPHRAATMDAINRFRADIAEAVFGSA